MSLDPRQVAEEGEEMHKIIACILAVSATGCYAGQFSQMNHRMAQMERANHSLRSQNAQLRQDSVRRGPDSKEPGPQRQTLIPGVVQITTGVKSWIRHSHGEYPCYVDRDPHLSQGDRIVFKNDIANNWGMDTVSNTVANKWVSIKLGGQPVRMVRSVVPHLPTLRKLARQGVRVVCSRSSHGTSCFTIGSYLGPRETCTAELGGDTVFSITAKLYKKRLGRHGARMILTRLRNSRPFKINPMIDVNRLTYYRTDFR